MSGHHPFAAQVSVKVKRVSCIHIHSMKNLKKKTQTNKNNDIIHASIRRHDASEIDPNDTKKV